MKILKTHILLILKEFQLKVQNQLQELQHELEEVKHVLETLEL
jgi:hypothetical protein